ncbi:MAG: hypothetical protein EOO61_17230 [Hymenobacter sp.]|nr:MAG: hypothetical protein EOO61_17230 [Hymenobacter sp.]
MPPHGTANKWAMVLNFAVRNRPGEHWVALYVDNSHGQKVVEYYDSLGDALPKTRMVGRTVAAIVPPDYTLHEVATQHQTDDYMCGVYACYYILARASGLPMDMFKKKIVTHNEIKAFRKASLLE